MKNSFLMFLLSLLLIFSITSCNLDLTGSDDNNTSSSHDDDDDDDDDDDNNFTLEGSGGN